MAKSRRGMIEILNDFYSVASPDAAEMVTRHAVRCNKDVQAKNGKAVVARVAKPRKVEPVVAPNGADKVGA